jgi:hypothetical protein
MEKQEQSRPIFDPEQVNRQVEYLASIQDMQMQNAVPGARTIAALKRITAENEQILANVWTQLAVHEATRQSLEHESAVVDLLQSRQRKDDTMLKTDVMPQLNTIESQPKPTPRRSRRLFALVAALLVVLFVGCFVTVLSLTHANNTHTGSLAHATPSPHPTAQRTWPVPSMQPIPGPAAANIISVGLSDKIDATTGLLLHPTNQFIVGQIIYLSCTATIPKQAGSVTITVKWYTNNHLYGMSTSGGPMKPDQTISAIESPVYELPAEGKAEVYLNNQLAVTLLFVVEPQPQH